MNEKEKYNKILDEMIYKEAYLQTRKRERIWAIIAGILAILSILSILCIVL